MCYPKPGPRCSNHAKKDYHKARETYHNVLAAHKDGHEPDDGAVSVKQAKHDMYAASVDYCSTPEGYQSFMKRAQELDDSGENGSFFEKIAEQGNNRRRMQLARLNINQDRPMIGASRTTSAHRAIKGTKVKILPHALR